METSRIFGLLCSGTAICCFLIAIAHRIKLCLSRSVSCSRLIGGRGHKSGRGIENFARAPIQKPPYLNPAYAPVHSNKINLLCTLIPVGVLQVVLWGWRTLKHCWMILAFLFKSAPLLAPKRSLLPHMYVGRKLSLYSTMVIQCT